MPGTWNRNNNTWGSFLPNNPNPTHLAINLLTGLADPNNDTMARPAPSSFYGVMKMTYGEREGLNISMDPGTVPCSASSGFLIESYGDEFILFWNRKFLLGMTSA